MSAFLPSKILADQGLAIVALVAAGLFSSNCLSAEESKIIEIRGIFVHATEQQRNAAFDAAQVDRMASVLTAEQLKIVRAALTKEGAEPFSEPRIIVQSGRSASVDIVKELNYALQYEPSKKGPEKWVPIRFQMRTVGVSLDTLASINPRGHISLKATPAFTRFLGFVDYGNLKPGETKIPTLEELLKAPLNIGGLWWPFFATFTGTRTVELEEGQAVVISGPVTLEQRTPPNGLPALQSSSTAPEILVLINVKKVVRH